MHKLIALLLLPLSLCAQSASPGSVSAPGVLDAPNGLTMGGITWGKYAGAISAAAPLAAGGCGIVTTGADQTSALNTCLTTGLSLFPNGFTLQLPPGDVPVCGWDFSARNVWLRGAGRGAGLTYSIADASYGGTRLIYASGCSAGYVIRMLGIPTPTAVNNFGNKITALKVSGNTSAAMGLRVLGQLDFTIEDISIDGYTTYGLSIEASASQTYAACGNGSGPGKIENLWLSSFGAGASGIHLAGRDGSVDVCSLQFSNIHIVYGAGNLGAHAILLENTDSDGWNQIEATTDASELNGTQVTSVTVSGGVASVVLNTSATIASGQSGIFFRGVTNCAGTAVPGLNGNFIATFSNTTHFTFPTSAANASYCIDSGAALAGAAVQLGSATGLVWQQIFSGMQTFNGFAAFPGSLINSTPDNLVLGLGWEEICGGNNYTCMSGMLNARTPIIMNSGDFGALTLNGVLYGRDPVNPTSRYSLLSTTSGGGLSIGGAVNLPSLTASLSLCLDGSKNITTSGCPGGGTPAFSAITAGTSTADLTVGNNHDFTFNSGSHLNLNSGSALVISGTGIVSNNNYWQSFAQNGSTQLKVSGANTTNDSVFFEGSTNKILITRQDGTLRATINDGVPILPNLPTSCSGQVTGTLWNNSNVLNICP